MSETPINADLKLLQRHWPHGYGADGAAVWAAAEAIYDGADDWEVEFAQDLAAMRPDGKGSLESKGRIDRMMMRRWRNGERPIPEWVATGLLRLPDIVLARRRRDAEHWLKQVREAERETAAFSASEEARLRRWVAEQVTRHVPAVERDPVKRPPPPRPVSPPRDWPAALPGEIEAAEDLGSLAALVEMGVVEFEAAPRPEHPALADAWDRGWSDAYDTELASMRETTERREAAVAAAQAAAEVELAAKAKARASKEAKLAADRKRRRSK